MSDNKQLLYNIFTHEPSSNLYNLSIYNSQYPNNDMYYSYVNLPKFISETHNTLGSIIPRIMNYIWFTNEDNPKQIPKIFLDNLKLELGKLNNYNLNAPEKWKVHLWVNCKICIESSIELISKMGYPVEIMEWKPEIFSNRSSLKDSVTTHINSKSNNGFGVAIDIARYMIAEKYGGFFLDLSYNTGNSTEIVVQQGCHSITSSENYYFGFKPQHKLLIWLNEELSTLFKIIEEHNISSVISNLDDFSLADFFSYGPYLSAMTLFLGKEDLSIEPDCSICDIQKFPIDRPELSYINLYDNEDIEPQCSASAPEICYVADHKNVDNSAQCNLIIKDTMIDFGYDNRNLGSTWEKDWQESAEI